MNATTTAPASPELIEAGVIMDTASGMVTVESIDTTNRTLLLKRADGDTATFKAGPEIRRFNELKAGDQIMSTVTDNCTIFVVKGKMTPSAAAQQAVVRAPDGRFEALWAKTFADVGPGDVLLFTDSSGALALAVSGGSAAGLLNLERDSEVTLRPS